MTARGKSRPRYIPTAEQIATETRVLEMRRMTPPMTFQAITDELGLSDRGFAHKVYQRALTRTLTAPANEIRIRESENLDYLQAAVWEKAMAGDSAAVRDVLRVMTRRARLLGLDHADGIAERSLQIEADKVRLMALAVGRMFDALELSPAQRERGMAVMIAELRAADGAPVPDDEDTVPGQVVDR